MEENLFEQRIDLSGLNRAVFEIKNEIGKVIIGQYKMVDLLLIGLLCDGHILIEGVPGVAKTLTAKLMAKIIDVDFSRLQFTPDLMPSDVVGTSVFNPREGDFKFKSGPIFSNIVLIDEINRAPAKTQAALFEVMEERQVTVDGVTHIMRSPFMVLATQNPIEYEGTFPLPEAQLDRFMLKLSVGHPTLEEEKLILRRRRERKQDEVDGDAQHGRARGRGRADCVGAARAHEEDDESRGRGQLERHDDNENSQWPILASRFKCATAWRQRWRV